MGKGKLAAQVAHASLGCILDMGFVGVKEGKLTYQFEAMSPSGAWLTDKFTKICLYVESEKDLDLIYENAKNGKLPAVLITDSGLTEFHGVPTKTCVGIGPAPSSLIDAVTGHLKLLP